MHVSVYCGISQLKRRCSLSKPSLNLDSTTGSLWDLGILIPSFWVPRSPYTKRELKYKAVIPKLRTLESPVTHHLHFCFVPPVFRKVFHRKHWLCKTFSRVGEGWHLDIKLINIPPARTWIFMLTGIVYKKFLASHFWSNLIPGWDLVSGLKFFGFRIFWNWEL